MKIFVSWSGPESKQIAQAVADWIPLIVQSAKPWISTGIKPGQRWGTEIGKELSESQFAIVCVTPTNTMSQWLHFEAGAISKSLQESRVVPYLTEVRKGNVEGPLTQFQMLEFNKEDTWKLILTIADSSENAPPEKQLQELFDAMWPRLEQRIESREKESLPPAAQPRSTEEIAMETLDTLRTFHREFRDEIQMMREQVVLGGQKDIPPETRIMQAVFSQLMNKGFENPEKLAQFTETIQRLQKKP